MRSALVNREVELGHARAALEQERPHQTYRAAANPSSVRKAVGTDEEQVPVNAKRTLFREFAMVVCVAVPAILAYPFVAVYLPQSVTDGVATMTGGLLSTGYAPAPATQAAVPGPAPAPAPERPTAVVTHAVNIRTTYSTKADVVLTLQRDTTVRVLQQHGSWTLVEFSKPGAAGKPQQGWVYSTYLKSQDEPGQPLAAPKAPAKPQNQVSTGAASPAAQGNLPAAPNAGEAQAAPKPPAKPQIQIGTGTITPPARDNLPVTLDAGEAPAAPKAPAMPQYRTGTGATEPSAQGNLPATAGEALAMPVVPVVPANPPEPDQAGRN